jgi:S-adenosylmethionine decarboxylase
MLFEGTEKKFELTVGPEGPDLLALGESFWDDVLRASGTVAISRATTPTDDGALHAWLLSESSLFVAPRWALMITCGRTTLIEGLLHALDVIGPQHVTSLIYERKNENFPAEQPTRFDDDVARLSDRLPGAAQVFGESDGDHISLFNLERPFTAPAGDTTLELLMHDIEPALDPVFVPVPAGGPGRAAIRERLGLGDLLPGFTLDDHLFSPVGYSLNAIAGRRYATLHVTPEREGSYASFEMGWDFGTDVAAATIARLLAEFAPARADLLYFMPPGRLTFLPEHYTPRRVTDAVLGNGYHVIYCHLERS